MRQSGFTLVEILVVVGLVVLIASMLPQGLNKLYAKSAFESFAQAVLSQLRDCASLSHTQQRAVEVGAQGCELPERSGFNIAYANDSAPVFFADGSSNGALLVVQDSNQGSTPAYQISVNRFSSKVSLQTHVSKP